MARFIVPNGCSDKHIRWFVFSLSGFRKNFTTFFFHNAIFFLFCFFRFLPFCFQPSFTRFLQLVFCKINLFPFTFSFVTPVTVRAMLTGIFICITDISIFLYAFLPRISPAGQYTRLRSGSLTKYPSSAFSSISS